MEILLILLVLALITLVGHTLWLIVASFFRLLAGTKAPLSVGVREPANDGERCVGCGKRNAPWQEHCPECGLGRRSQTAAELQELQTTQRQLAKLRDAGILDPATLERVQNCVATRRKALLTVPRQAASPAAAKPKQLPTPVAEQPLPPLWERLQRLLESCPDVSSLPPKQRHQALLWYPQLAEDQLASLSAKAQLALARLLRQVRKTDDSLRAYRRLLARYSDDPESADWAIEAGRFAAEKKITDQACEFLNRALRGALSAERRQETQQLLDNLRRPAKQDIAEVSPALQVPSRAALSAPRSGARALSAPRPRPSLGEVLAAFMEERNIFWGELVGGLLMVGCSIALVVYLWKDLERIPYFQYLIFVGTTACVFGAGLYCQHRLKLRTTSRGLLVIATLLVPLNFLVMAGLAGQRTEPNPYDTALRIGIEIGSLIVFAALINAAARVLLGSGRWLLTLTILGVSASQLAVPRVLDFSLAEHVGRTSNPSYTPGLLSFILLSCLPVAFYGLGTNGFVYRLSSRRPIEQNDARTLFAFLGIAAFALTVAVGLLVYASGDIGMALERLAPLIALSGVPALAGGLLVHHHLRPVSGDKPETAAAIRTIGTVIALAGMLIMLAAAILAWPQPAALMLVCALNFTVLTAVAFYYRERFAHAVALPCLGLAYLIAFHLLLGHVSSEETGWSLAQQLLSAQSGSALTGLVALLGVAAMVLVRAGRQDQAVCYAMGSGAAALISLLLVNKSGLTDPGAATIVTACYATAGLAIDWYWRRTGLRYFSLALVLVTTLWALWWVNGALTPVWGTVLAVEAFIMAAVAPWTDASVRGRQNMDGASDPFSRPLPFSAWRDIAATAGLLALALVLASPESIRSSWHTVTGVSLVPAACLLALCYRSRVLTWVTSALLLATLLHGFTWGFAVDLAHPAAAALLAHATFVFLGSLFLRAILGSKNHSALSPIHTPVSRMLIEPLFQSTLATSLAALPVLLITAWGNIGALALYLGWLSAVWLFIAWTARWPWLFAAFQMALTGTVTLAATVWLESQTWVIGQYPEALLDPRSLQTYGICLGLLGLFWLAARFALRENPEARHLFEPGWPAVDWVMLGILVLGQFGLAIWGILPGTVQELAPIGTPLAAWPAAHLYAYGPGAWALVGVLAIILIVALWEREQAAAMAGLIILAVTDPFYWRATSKKSWRQPQHCAGPLAFASLVVLSRYGFAVS